MFLLFIIKNFKNYGWKRKGLKVGERDEYFHVSHKSQGYFSHTDYTEGTDFKNNGKQLYKQ